MTTKVAVAVGAAAGALITLIFAGVAFAVVSTTNRPYTLSAVTASKAYTMACAHHSHPSKDYWKFWGCRALVSFARPGR